MFNECGIDKRASRASSSGGGEASKSSSGGANRDVRSEKGTRTSNVAGPSGQVQRVSAKRDAKKSTGK